MKYLHKCCCGKNATVRVRHTYFCGDCAKGVRKKKNAKYVYFEVPAFEIAAGEVKDPKKLGSGPLIIYKFIKKKI